MVKLMSHPGVSRLSFVARVLSNLKKCRQRIRKRLPKFPPNGDWFVAFPVDKIDISTIDKRRGDICDFARLSNEQMDFEAFLSVSVHRLTGIAGLRVTVLALPFEDFAREKLVLVFMFSRLI